MLINKPSPELYKTLLEETRDNPAYKLDRIALAYNVDPVTFLNWYENGLPEDTPNLENYVGGGAPIKDLVTLSNVRTRAAMQEEYVPSEEMVQRLSSGSRSTTTLQPKRTSAFKLDAAWGAAKDDAIESLALKGKSARAARQNAAQLLGITSQMLALSKPLLKRLEQQMNDPEYLNGLEVWQIIAHYGKLARMSKDVMECAKFADDIETILLGDPNSLTKTETVDIVSDGDALAVISAAAEAAEIARESGLDTVVGGYTGEDDN